MRSRKVFVALLAPIVAAGILAPLSPWKYTRDYDTDVVIRATIENHGYLPTYGSPETNAILVRATQRAGGRLAALPGGELRSEKLTTTRVGAAGRERALRWRGRA